MLKRIISVILVLCLIMGAAVGCGGETTEQPGNDVGSGNVENGGSADGGSTEQGGSNEQGGTSSGGSTEQGGTSNNLPPVAAEKKMIQNKEKIRVLCIGHSFSNNSTQYASQLVGDFGGNLEISSLYYAGCTLEEHYNFYVNNEAVFHLFTNGVQVTKEKVTSKWVLENHEYDIITFQGHSVNMDDIATFEKLVPLYEKVKAHQPNAQFMIHQTWSLCWRRNIGRYPAANLGRDQFEKVKECFKIASERLGNVPIVPVGEAVQLAKEEYGFSNDYGKASSIYADEVSHLSERGCFLAACVWAQFLYKDEIDVRQNTASGYGGTKSDRDKLAEVAYRIVMGK